MLDEKFQTLNQKSSTLRSSRDKRYELIVQAATQIDERKSNDYREDEKQQIWDTNDISLDFGNVIKLYD